ncbi:MAG: Fur family transcriptional regulator [Chloroflexota bacterium]|nr:Fur family transcriptional regulator [Chloroflexota bacterium]
MITERQITSILKKRGYKLTPQRKAILKVITQSYDHLTPYNIYERVHQESPDVGLVTVYRTLDLLTKLGLICEVHAEGNCHSYLVKRPSEQHHHHLLCSQCGTVVDFVDCGVEELQERLCQKTGFEIHDHLLEFVGCCRNCQKTTPS